MSLTMAGNLIPGYVLPFVLPRPQPQVRRTHFWGIKGESQIVGSLGPRSLQIEMWLSDPTFDSHAALDNYIRQTLNDAYMYMPGTLIVTGGGAAWTAFEDCTWMGVDIRNTGIIPNIGGGMPGAWICPIIAHIRQHLDEPAP